MTRDVEGAPAGEIPSAERCEKIGALHELIAYVLSIKANGGSVVNDCAVDDVGVAPLARSRDVDGVFREPSPGAPTQLHAMGLVWSHTRSISVIGVESDQMPKAPLITIGCFSRRTPLVKMAWRPFE